MDTEYQDIRTHNRSAIITQIKTTQITMLIGLTKITMQTNAIQTMMSIGTAGAKTKTKQTNADEHKTRRHILFAFDFTSHQVVADTKKPGDCIIVTLGESNG